MLFLPVHSKTILQAPTVILALVGSVMTQPGMTKAQTATWVPVASPAARCCMGFAYDGATLSTVLFGGGGSSVYGDTWVWRGAWRKLSPVTSPSPREYPGMAFDEAAGNIVLFGGNTTRTLGGPTTMLGDTWTWDGTTWTQQFPSVSPPARTWVSMAYDPANKTVVLFGGNNEPNGNGPFGDTWTWDGIAKTWTQHIPATSPSPRGSPALAYNSAAGNVVLFGGIIANLGYLNDTWTWDATNWTQRFPLTSPPALNAPDVAYDPGLSAVVMFDGSYENATWTWNGTNWTQIFPSNALPAGRAAAGRAYDPIEKATLLFGGNSGGSFPLGDTWLLALVP